MIYLDLLIIVIEGLIAVMARIDEAIDCHIKAVWDANTRTRTNITRRPICLYLRGCELCCAQLYVSCGLKTKAPAPRSFMIGSISIFPPFNKVFHLYTPIFLTF